MSMQSLMTDMDEQKFDVMHDEICKLKQEFTAFKLDTLNSIHD